MATVRRILFVTLTNDVGSERIVSELGRQGAACAVLGAAACFAALSRFVETRFAVPTRFGSWASTLGLRHRLGRAVRSWHPDRIVPLDELSALVLRTIAADRQTRAEIRDVLVASLGRIEGYHASCHRAPLMTLAARLGIRVPAFAAAGGDTASVRIAFPLMVKRDHSSGSGGVALAENAVALNRLLRTARLKAAAKQAMARLAGFRHGASPLLLQQYVPGDLAMRTVVCRDGLVLDGINMRAVQVHPTKRASTILQSIENADMDEAARKLVAALGSSGFVSFDFILDSNGHAHLIEMNPRAIGSTHLGRLFGHDLGNAFLDGAAMTEGRSTDELSPGTRVALFPKELERDPDSACLSRAPGCYHDVPRDEPQILEAYLGHLGQLYPAAIGTLRSRLGVAVPVTAADPDGNLTSPLGQSA